MPQGSNEPLEIPLDLILTPFGELIVIDYHDPNAGKRKGWDFSERCVSFFGKKTPGFEEEVIRYAREHPDIEVAKVKRDGIYSVVDVPAGRIGEILSDSFIRSETKRYRAQNKEEEARAKKELKNVYFQKPAPFKKHLEGIRYHLSVQVLNQLVRKSSVNDLSYSCPSPPKYVLPDENNRGLAIIDTGVDSNCGFGQGSAVWYEILRKDVIRTNEPGPFPRRTLYLRNSINTWIQFLPPSAHVPSELARIASSPDYRLVNFSGSLAIIGVKPGQQDPRRLLEALALPSSNSSEQA